MTGQFWGREECRGCEQLEKQLERTETENNNLRGAMAELLYVGNRLARGEVTADEWHEAVRKATPAPTVCKRPKR